MKVIVVSAVNLVEAGPLFILRDCLSYLSELAKEGEYRIVAVVHKKELAFFPHIEYIETPWPKKNWLNRLWFEYVTLKKISKRLAPVYLWFSLHDTSPSVVAERRAVYCHNSFSFYNWQLHDLVFAPKIALFALFTKYIYRTNIHKNKYLVVQQDWFRSAMGKQFGIHPSKIIVSLPQSGTLALRQQETGREGGYSFLFAGSPNSHKNFEVLCRAVDLLENAWGISNFTVRITVKGQENRYAQWLHQKWGHLKSLEFLGFLDKETLNRYYGQSNALVFPSKVETWGLPISEFASLDRPMLLADLPYAHETAAGSKQVAFFNPGRAEELAGQMKRLIQGDGSFLKALPKKQYPQPVTESWASLFTILLKP